MIANIQRAQGQTTEAKRSALRAIEIEPTWPDGYFLLARIAYEAGRFSECIEWTKAGATKNPPVTGLIVDPRDYHYWPYYYLGLAYLQLGAFEEGIANLLRAIEHTPDPEAVAMLRTVVDEKGRQDAAHEFLALFERLARNDEWLKARELFRLAPKSVEQHPAIREWWLKVQQMTAHVDDPEVMVDFYRDNPGWHPYPDELIERDGEGTGIAPRIAFARKALCAPPKYVLDIGSADGFISLPLARDGYHVTGFDLDPRCVELANQRATKWSLPARYSTGSIDDALAGDATYDAVIAFEIIEHLVDPGAFLDKLGMAANKVILTTPHLSWENGHYKDWDKVELKGHIRIFDLSDMEILMGQRGRIVDLYREPFGPSGWIFASYYPKQYTRGSVTFVAPGTLESWSPRKLKEQGLGGSETALIRLAEEFAAKQMSVSVYGRIDQPGYYNGVRYRQSEQFIPEVRQDMVVAWRAARAGGRPAGPEYPAGSVDARYRRRRAADA
jgi:2-polyprenyl-3-methyl-5-hydroxy-6-metoxy-1,4-benzoquinol methylase